MWFGVERRIYTTYGFLWAIGANSSNISPFTIHLPTTFLVFFGLIHADAMRNTCAILILLGAVCSVDAYHCKAESNQTRSARHEIRVCERRLAIQCNKQNRPSVADFE